LGSIRNPRDMRFNVRTSTEKRGPESGAPEKQRDAQFTAHGSADTQAALNGEPSSTDQLVDHAHRLLRDQLAPRIQTRSANALTVDRREFYYFHRKRSGRRCSCVYHETEAHDSCPVCYGVGVVGGYEKFGCHTESLDFTTPGLILVNVEPNFDEDTRPVHLRLMEGAKFGYAEAEFQLKANTGAMDTCLLSHPIFNRGARVIAIAPDNTQAEIRTPRDLEPFLLNPKVRIRVEMRRLDARPVFTHFVWRYKHRDSAIVWGDVPQLEDNLASSQFGELDLRSDLTVFFDGKQVRNVQNEDLIYRLSDGVRFKIKMVKPNMVAGTLTSTDTTCRYLIPNVDNGAQLLLV
jgi:hypothetical protein